jgi:hypothetical protein
MIGEVGGFFFANEACVWVFLAEMRAAGAVTDEDLRAIPLHVQEGFYVFLNSDASYIKRNGAFKVFE